MCKWMENLLHIISLLHVHFLLNLYAKEIKKTMWGYFGLPDEFMFMYCAYIDDWNAYGIG